MLESQMECIPKRGFNLIREEDTQQQTRTFILLLGSTQFASECTQMMSPLRESVVKSNLSTHITHPSEEPEQTLLLLMMLVYVHCLAGICSLLTNLLGDEIGEPNRILFAF